MRNFLDSSSRASSRSRQRRSRAANERRSAPRKLAVIVAGVLACAENVDDFVGPFRHYRMKYDAVDQRENGGVNTDRQREREHRYRSESWRLEKLTESELQILDHETFLRS